MQWVTSGPSAVATSPPILCTCTRWISACCLNTLSPGHGSDRYTRRQPRKACDAAGLAAPAALRFGGMAAPLRPLRRPC